MVVEQCVQNSCLAAFDDDLMVADDFFLVVGVALRFGVGLDRSCWGGVDSDVDSMDWCFSSSASSALQLTGGVVGGSPETMGSILMAVM